MRVLELRSEDRVSEVRLRVRERVRVVRGPWLSRDSNLHVVTCDETRIKTTRIYSVLLGKWGFVE